MYMVTHVHKFSLQHCMCFRPVAAFLLLVPGIYLSCCFVLNNSFYSVLKLLTGFAIAALIAW